MASDFTYNIRLSSCYGIFFFNFFSGPCWRASGTKACVICKTDSDEHFLSHLCASTRKRSPPPPKACKTNPDVSRLFTYWADSNLKSHHCPQILLQSWFLSLLQMNQCTHDLSIEEDMCLNSSQLLFVEHSAFKHLLEYAVHDFILVNPSTPADLSD